MQEDTKISDLTVAEFRTLMQQCLDRDRAMAAQREMARRQSNAAQGEGNPYTSGGQFGGNWIGG